MGTHRSGITLVVFGFLWIWAPGEAQTVSAPSVPGSDAPNARVLAPEQIRAAFAGNMASGEDEDGKPFVAYFSENQGLKVDYGNTTYRGTWYINNDGKLCGQLEEFFVTDTMCFSIDRYDGRPGEGYYALVSDKERIEVRVVRSGESK
jgi:hypothetical protein